jgi:cobyrinic acid a,c-diamide synthase
MKEVGKDAKAKLQQMLHKKHHNHDDYSLIEGLLGLYKVNK